MKRRILFLMLSLMVFFTISCKDDSESVTPTLLGKWYAKTVNYTSYTNGVIEEKETGNYDHGLYFDFKDDGRVNVRADDGVVDTYEYDFDKTKMKITIYDESEDDEFQLDVTKLTGVEMIMVLEEEYSAYGTTIKSVTEYICER